MSNKSTKVEAVEKAPRVTHISQVRSFYVKNVLPKIGRAANKELRGSVIAYAENTLGASKAAAASMFNVVQKENIESGAVAATAVGRGAQAAKKPAVVASLPWAVVDKASRKLVHTYASRSQAKAVKTADQTVCKTADL